MKKFAFTHTDWIKKYYDFLLNKEKNNKYLSDVIKISILWVVILVCLAIYFRYVSLSSTEWFFYRQASNQLSATQFKYEIEKTEILEKTQKNRDTMYSSNQNKKVIDVRTEYVKVPTKTELTYK